MVAVAVMAAGAMAGMAGMAVIMAAGAMAAGDIQAVDIQAGVAMVVVILMATFTTLVHSHTCANYIMNSI